MRFGTRTRKTVLLLHIVSCLGWMGAVACFIVLDVATVTATDGAVLRAAYIGMDLITDWIIVPLAVASLASGVAISLGTTWGLFRHWWVVVSLVLTVASTLVLLVQTPLITHRADVAADPGTTDPELRQMGNLLLHSIGGAVVLAIIAALNVFKPRGLTRYGWRREHGPRPPMGDAG